MRLTEAQNKRIAEKLGLCWHNTEAIVRVSHVIDIVCTRCLTVQEDPGDLNNVPFDSEKGFLLIIENGEDKGWWGKFVQTCPKVFRYNFNAIYFDGLEWAIKRDYIGARLAEALIEWIEKENK